MILPLTPAVKDPVGADIAGIPVSTRRREALATFHSRIWSSTL